MLAATSVPLPRAKLFYAVATGYSGLVGAYAKRVTNAPLLVTEHGIYTNERRIELAVADWLFESGAGGFGVGGEPAELRSLWLDAFQSFSRISYAAADVITTQYRANQTFQHADGAPYDKLRIIPNGIDVAKFAAIPRNAAPRRPTVLMIGRIVPIKDVRTFIMAVALLKDLVPEVLAILIGPEDEDPEYAAGCRALVRQLGVEASIAFLGRVPDVTTYLASSDVLALFQHKRSPADRRPRGRRDRTGDRHHRRRLLPRDHRGLFRRPGRRAGRLRGRALQPAGAGGSAGDDPARRRAARGHGGRHAPSGRRLLPQGPGDETLRGPVGRAHGRAAFRSAREAVVSGVDNAIELMTRRGTLSGLLAAYLYAALLVAGPWIFTVLGLVSLDAASCEASCDGLTVFRSIVIYNSMYALVVTSPVAFVTGRWASERVQGGREANVFYGVVVSLGLYAVLSLAIVAPGPSVVART